jgi:hypothetical protein
MVLNITSITGTDGIWINTDPSQRIRTKVKESTSSKFGIQKTMTERNVYGE